MIYSGDFSHPHIQQPVTAPTQSTTSAWVDSSQLQSIEPYSQCQLTKSFAATVADELSIVKGMKAKAIYRYFRILTFTRLCDKEDIVRRKREGSDFTLLHYGSDRITDHSKVLDYFLTFYSECKVQRKIGKC